MSETKILPEIGSFSNDLSNAFPGCESAVSELICSLQTVVNVADYNSPPFSSEVVDAYIFHLLKCMSKNGVHPITIELYNQFGFIDPNVIRKILEKLYITYKPLSYELSKKVLDMKSIEHDTLISLLLGLLQSKVINEELVKYFVYITYETGKHKGVYGGINIQSFIDFMGQKLGISKKMVIGGFALLTASSLLVVINFVQSILDFARHTIKSTAKFTFIEGLGILSTILFVILKFLWGAIRGRWPGVNLVRGSGLVLPDYPRGRPDERRRTLIWKNVRNYI